MNEIGAQAAQAPLAVLIVSDDGNRIASLIGELRRGGFDPRPRAVATAAAMRAALEREPWDVVLAGDGRGVFGGLDALRELHACGLDVPLIVVSDEEDPQGAVATMKAGVHDFVMKGHLSRLAAAVAREMGDARLRRERRRVDAELRESERSSNRAQKIGRFGSWELDARTGLLELSRQMYSLLGLDPDVFDGTVGSALVNVHSEDLPGLRRMMETARAGGPVEPRELRILEPEGAERVIRAEAEAVRDERGEVVRMTGFAQDVTERQRAQRRQELAVRVLERLNQSNHESELSRSMLALMKESTGIEAAAICIRSGTEFPCREMSGFSGHPAASGRPAICWLESGTLNRQQAGQTEPTGVCRQIANGQLHGRQRFLTARGSLWFNSVDPLDRASGAPGPVLESRHECLARGYESQAFIPLRVDDEVIGLIHLADRRPGRFSDDLIHFLEGLGSSIGIAVGRLQAKVALLQERNLLRALMESIPDSVYIKDLESRFVRISRSHAAMLGLDDPGDAVGRTESQIRPSARSRAVELEEQGIVRTLTPVVGDVETHVPDEGPTRWTSTSRVPICDEAGRVSGILCVSRDITREMLLQDQILQSEKMAAVGRLAGGVAHDFNNMLTIILGFGEIVLSGLPQGSPASADMESILQAARQGATLTGQLLAFSRKQVIEPRVLDLNGKISDLERMLTRLIGEDIEIVTSLSGNLARVKADPGQIEQVILNVVVNARDAMPRGGRLTIDTSNVCVTPKEAASTPEARAGRYCLLKVTDNGSGMTEETVKHIFEPFFTTKGPGRGTGLGLAVIHGIVRQHGGWIGVKSREGCGTAFEVYLPACCGEEPDLVRACVSREPEDLKGRGEHLLVVEDEEGLRRWLSRILRSEGYLATFVACATDAIQVFGRDPEGFDLVFSDMALPDRTGLELRAHVLAARPGLPVLLSTGYTGERFGWETIQKSGASFLQKPYGASTLLHKLRELLAGGPARRRSADGCQPADRLRLESSAEP